MDDLLLAGENKIKINEAKQSQRSAAPAGSPPASWGISLCTCCSEWASRWWLVEIRSTQTVTYMLLFSIFGNHCRLYPASRTGCVALSSFGLWESIDREENVLRSGPISIGLLRKVFRRLWRAYSIYLILSSGRLANCKGWIAVFPKRTLLAFGTDSSSLFGTVSRVTGCSASLFSAQ